MARHIKDLCREALNYAVRLGVVKRPSVCSRCGAAGNIHGHHADHNKPLEVLWLCERCHLAEHGGRFRPLGSKNKKHTRRTPTKVVPPRPYVTVKEVADCFGVTPDYVRKVVKNGLLPCLRIGRTIRIINKNLPGSL